MRALAQEACSLGTFEPYYQCAHTRDPGCPDQETDRHQGPLPASSSRKRIHADAYTDMRAQTGLPAEDAHMAVDQAVALARCCYGLRRSKHRKHTPFPKVRGVSRIGRGIHTYAIYRFRRNLPHRYVLAS